MKNILIFILLVLAGVAGIPSWPKTQTSVGYYKISKNPYGVAIFQDGLHNSVQFVDAESFTLNGSVITIPASKIVYGRDDIIFDESSIFTDPTQEQIDYLGKEKTSSSVLPDTFYLVNPRIPGKLEINGSNLLIDVDQKQITGTIKNVIIHDAI